MTYLHSLQIDNLVQQQLTLSILVIAHDSKTNTFINKVILIKTIYQFISILENSILCLVLFINLMLMEKSV